MKRFLAILVFLFPLAAITAQAGTVSSSGPDAQARRGALPVNASPARSALPDTFSRNDGKAPFVVAHSAADSPVTDMKKPDNGSGPDLDLRYVDWDNMKAGAKGKNGKTLSAKNGDTGEAVSNGGDEEDENGEDEEGEKEDQEEKDGGGGWDRPWDAPKAG